MLGNATRSADGVDDWVRGVVYAMLAWLGPWAVQALAGRVMAQTRGLWQVAGTMAQGRGDGSGVGSGLGMLLPWMLVSLGVAAGIALTVAWRLRSGAGRRGGAQMGGGEDGALARGAVTMAVWLLGGLALWPRAWRLLGGPHAQQHDIHLLTSRMLRR